MRLSLAVVGIFGLLVGVSTYFVVTLQREEIAQSKEEFERYKIEAAAEADTKIGVAREEARAAGEKAAADIVKANAEIVEAKRQTAVLEKETAQARAEQERLKQLVTWRSIPSDTQKRIAARLAVRKKAITIAVVANDPEAMAFASNLSVILREANWVATPRAVSWGAWLPIGLTAYGPDEEAVTMLREAFLAEGVPFGTSKPLHDPDWSIVFEENEPSTATLLVGSKIGPM